MLMEVNQEYFDGAVFINFFTVVKMRSRGCSPGRADIPTSSNAKKVCLYLCKAVIKCMQENAC